MRGKTIASGAVLAALAMMSCKGAPETIGPDPRAVLVLGGAQGAQSLPGQPTGAAQPPLRSMVAVAPASFSADAQGRTVLMRVAGHDPVTVIALDKHQPDAVFGANAPGELVDHLTIAAQDDFAGDGHVEALVELDTQGNACGPSYLLALDAPTGTGPASRWVTDIFAQCTEGGASVQAQGKQKAIVIPEQGSESRYVFAGVRAPSPDGGPPGPHVTRLPVARREVVMKTDAELDTTGLEAPKTLTFDLNGDGKPDTIECAPARNAICTITLAPNHEVGVLVVSSRIGVLPTKTKGMRDLVVGQTVVHWDGSAYQ